MTTIIFNALSLIIFAVLTLISATPLTNFTIAKPNCVDHCGNISIPFPFGTTESCYRNSSFLVTCNTSFTPPKLFLQDSTIEITNISLQGQLKLMNYVVKSCYSEDGTLVSDNNPSIQLPNPFTVNNTANKFTILGCDTYGFISGYKDNRTYQTGCSSTCEGMDDLSEGSCEGLGCCQVTGIPKDFWRVELELNSFSNHTNVWEFNNCSYGFIVEESAFRFSPDNLTNMEHVEELPMVVDWAVGNENCDSAQINSSSYACISPNTVCYEPENGYGYRCRCEIGYQGNPYLMDGCQDINECDFPKLSNCTYISRCENSPGNFTCRCPKGYRGSGIGVGGCSPLESRTSKLVAGLILASILIALLSVIFAFSKFVKKKMKQQRRKKFFKLNGGLLLKQETSSNKGILRRTRLFTAKELEKATDHFNETRILGRGGQGTVYKGMLSDGQIVAIKKSKLVDENKSKHLVEQFINEVVILSLISHRNVVKLLGCCLEMRIPLLVYEFMPNGTLSDLIQGKNIEFPFTWAMRLKTAADIAGALAYLHSATSVPIFHRDVKSSNILLDEKFIAKVSDFGTSKSVEVDQTHLTTMVKGTFGYIDPEYFQSSQFTEKSDVYSFGVVLVELLTGLKPIMAITSTEDDNKSLVTCFLSAMRDDNLELILEGQVSGEEEKKEVVAVAELAKRCLHLNGKKRPYMTEVAMELEAVRKSGMKSNNTTELPGDFNITNSAFSVEDSEYGWTHTSEFDTMSSSDVHPIMLNTI